MFMHLLAEEDAVINRPVTDVYNYATNMELFGTWFPGVKSIKSTNGHEHGQAGKEYLETVQVPFQGTKEILLTVIESEMNRFFATEGKFPPLYPRMEIIFSHAGFNACRITWRMYSRSTRLIVRLLLLPFARRLMSKRAKVGIMNLKKIIENI